MKYFVISDTHGRLERVYEVYNGLEGIDAIIHLGDYEKDAGEISEKLKIDVISVKGNMDGGFGEWEHKILQTECGKLYLTHGHLENVKINYQNVYYHALENQCIAALFGHTHKAMLESIGDIYLINPGSLCLPADGSRGTYAILETSREGLKAKICQYDNTPPVEERGTGHRSEKPKVQGGYLRGLLNYSDRF